MDKMETRLDSLNRAKKRIGKLNLDDPITIVHLDEKDPRRHAYFVEFKTETYANNFTFEREYLVTCTNKNGYFWQTDIRLVYQKHLQYTECVKIYKLIRAVFNLAANNKSK